MIAEGTARTAETNAIVNRYHLVPTWFIRVFWKASSCNPLPEPWTKAEWCGKAKRKYSTIEDALMDKGIAPWLHGEL